MIKASRVTEVPAQWAIEFRPAGLQDADIDSGPPQLGQRCRHDLATDSATAQSFIYTYADKINRIPPGTAQKLPVRQQMSLRHDLARFQTDPGVLSFIMMGKIPAGPGFFIAKTLDPQLPYRRKFLIPA